MTNSRFCFWDLFKTSFANIEMVSPKQNKNKRILHKIEIEIQLILLPLITLKELFKAFMFYFFLRISLASSLLQAITRIFDFSFYKKL